MKFGVRTFILPGQEKQLEALLNEPLITVTTNKEFFSSKDGLLIVYVQFEDYREEGALI